jgi:hypothetical protein
MSWGGGGTLISMPSTPWPKSVEFQRNHLAAANTNPFTAQQQTQDWGVDYMEASISLPPMTQSKATPWITFLQSLNGIVNVFQFPAGLAAQYPESFTSDGTNQRYWRLKSNTTSWSIKPVSIYGLTFEIREAI